MRMRTYLALMLICLVAPASNAQAAPAGLLSDLGLPEIAGSSVTSEIDLTNPALLQSVENDYGDELGISALKRLRLVTLEIGPSPDEAEILATYDSALIAKGWQSVSKSKDKRGAHAYYSNQKDALLILSIDPPSKKRNREITFTWLQGKLTPGGGTGGGVPRIQVTEPAVGTEDSQNSLKIMPGKPISVPPAQWMKLEATNTDLKLRLVSGNTVEVRTSTTTESAGSFSRPDDGLILALSPKLRVDEIILPGTTPLTVEVTGGSLAAAYDLGLMDVPANLQIKARAASVSLDPFPLISGTHKLDVVGGKVQMMMPRARAGSLDLDSSGGDVTLGLAKDSSVLVSVEVVSGTIQNLTGVKPESESADRMQLKMGEGKARINLKAANGAVRLQLNP